MAKNSEKLSFKQVEIPLNKFHDVIPQYITKLQEHKQNIQRYVLVSDWDRIRIEQSNANKIIKQLNLLLYELEQLKLQVKDDDIGKFDRGTAKLKDKIQNIVKEYLDLMNKRNLALNDDTNSESNSQPSTPDQIQTQLQISESQQEELERKQACLHATEQLQVDLEDLHSSFLQLHSLVHEQDEVVNEIENNVENAAVNVSEGGKWIAKAAKYNAILSPIGGAVICGCIGGPIGLLVGLKVASLTTVGCGCLGFLGAKALKATANESATDLEPTPEVSNVSETSVKDKPM